MSHKKVVLHFLPGCKLERNAPHVVVGMADRVYGPTGKTIAYGATPQQAWFLARLQMSQQGVEVFR